MSAESPPYVIQASSHSAALFRQAVSSLLGATQPGTLTLAAASAGSSPSGAGATAVGGVVNLTDLAVTQNGTPNMSVNVAGGSVWIPQTQAANGGLYFGLNDATVNLSIAAASATNPRIDTVVATVNDAAYSGSSNNWTLSVLTGTPTSGASLSNLSGKATQSASSVVIAYVLVPANATSITSGDLLDARPFVTLGFPQRGVPAASMHATGATSCSNITWTSLGSMTSDWVRGGVTVSSNQFTLPVAGVYRYTGGISISNNNTGLYGAGVGKGGTVQASTVTFTPYINPSSGGSVIIPVSADVLHAAGDTAQLMGYQGTGGANNMGSSDGITRLTVALISI